jgi:hypothetical protein
LAGHARIPSPTWWPATGGLFKLNAVTGKTKAMSASSDADSDIASLRDDFAVLKHDVAVLVEHLKASATSGTQSAAARIDSNAREALRGITALSGRGLRAAGSHVEKQPMTALLIILALGVAGVLSFRRGGI